MIDIELEQGVSERAEFRPGEKIRGTVQWLDLPEDSTSISVRLLWYTQGKGDRNVEVLNNVEIPISEFGNASGQFRFEFVAPNRPYSFAGALIELTWAVEAIVYPEEDSVLKKISIGPDGKSVVLDKTFEGAMSAAKRFLSGRHKT